MKKADRAGIRYAVILGSDENWPVARCSCATLTEGAQEEVAQADLPWRDCCSIWP
jgi:hypothetical protein